MNANPKSAQTLRLFVALTLPEKARRHIVRHTAGLRQSLRHLRWQPPQKLHITLRFLGDVGPEAVPHLQHAIRDLCADSQPLHLRTLGAQVLAQRALAVLVGGDERLAILKHDLDERLSDLASARGLAALATVGAKSVYVPHITIARMKKGLSPPDIPDMALSFTPSRMALIASELHRSGSIYTELWGMPLGRGNGSPAGAPPEGSAR